MEVSSEQIDEVPIPTDQFIKKISKKMAEYKTGPMDLFYGAAPFIQWNNMKLKGNTWLIEKSRKSTDDFSTGRASGTIKVEIIAGEDKTVLKAHIRTDAGTQDAGRYVLAFALGITALAYLIIDFSLIALAVWLLVEWLLLKVLPRIYTKLNSGELENLTKYYNLLLKEASTV
jgi:hypothetical protein